MIMKNNVIFDVHENSSITVSDLFRNEVMVVVKKTVIKKLIIHVYK